MSGRETGVADSVAADLVYWCFAEVLPASFEG